MSSFDDAAPSLPLPAPTGTALQDSLAAAFATNKALRADYWFTPGAADAPRLGYVGNDIKTSRKKLVFGDDEYTSWIDGMRKTSDETAFICETANSIYIVPAERGALKAIQLRPGMAAYE